MSGHQQSSIRAFRPSDLGPLRRLIHETIDISYGGTYPPRAVAFFKDFHSEERILARSRSGTTLVAEEAGEAIATGSLVDDEILAVFVHPRFQQGGCGKAPMRLLEDAARAEGLKHCGLSVSLPSKRFYQGLGYQIVEDCSKDLGAGQRLKFRKPRKRLEPVEP